MDSERALSTVSNPSSPTASEVLRAAQASTLARAPREHGLLARTLFATMDLVYGRRLTLERFEALELIARVPYQAWEGVGYTAITHQHARPAFARRIFDYVQEARAAQDNEQWHLFILEELLAHRAEARSWLRSRVIPQLIAVVYYHVSWLLYVIAPRLSYALNADFEDHAERGYMQYVHEHPELEHSAWTSAYQGDYGRYATVADVLRRVAIDERVHRDESLARIACARYRSDAHDALATSR